jgi:hypothetical protein
VQFPEVPGVGDVVSVFSRIGIRIRLVSTPYPWPARQTWPRKPGAGHGRRRGRRRGAGLLQRYLHIDNQSAAFISLPAFPLGVDAVRLQRVVSSMKRFGLLPKNTNFQITSMITG